MNSDIETGTSTSSSDLSLLHFPPVNHLVRDCQPHSVVIGRDIETGESVSLGDIERQGGTYVLGGSGKGKSSLLENIAVKDIEHGHGVFFLDPHGDAINEILAGLPPERENDVIVLNPKDKIYSFGINLLRCPDPTDPIELDDTCGRVLSAFGKVWGNENGELGLWLKKILRNSIYLLLENPGYTIVEIPNLLSEDTRFRNFLLQNVKVKRGVNEFWFNEFDRLSTRDKTEQVGPALSRLEIFGVIHSVISLLRMSDAGSGGARNPHILPVCSGSCAPTSPACVTLATTYDAMYNTILNNIFGQKEPKIDFHDILNSRDGTQKIVLLRLSSGIDSDVKKLIGTILISELLHAMRERPRDSRQQFSIFVDEVQNFTGHEDFSILFTEARKWGIATTVAHQERYGQLDQKLQGATDQAAIKIFFQLSVRDSKEQALTITKKPPQEAFVISRTPFDDLLNGHTNPKIQSFTDRYLRSLHDQLEDVKGEIEAGRSIRTYHQDTAALDRIGASWGAVTERAGRGIFDPVDASNAISRARAEQYAALSRAHTALTTALGHSEELVRLNKSSNELRLTKRGLDLFLTAIMEGSIREGQQAFTAFLMHLVCLPSFALVTEDSIKVLELYLALKYEDPKIPRIIPFEFAKTNRLFSNTISEIQEKALAKLNQEKQKFLENAWQPYHQNQRKHDEYRRKDRQERQENALKEIYTSRLDLGTRLPLSRYMLLHESG